MTALFICLIILALLAAVLLSFVTLSLEYNETFLAHIKFLGFKFSLSKERKKKKASKKEEKEKEDSPLVLRFKKNSFSENISLVSDAVKDALPIFSGLLKRIRVRRFTLNIRIASFDAAKTAILYGRVCSAVYPTISLLSGITDMSVKEVDITSAFGESKSSARFFVNLKMRVIILVIAAVKFFFVYKKMTEETQNERKQHKVDN